MPRLCITRVAIAVKTSLLWAWLGFVVAATGSAANAPTSCTSMGDAQIADAVLSCRLV